MHAALRSAGRNLVQASRPAPHLHRAVERSLFVGSTPVRGMAGKAGKGKKAQTPSPTDVSAAASSSTPDSVQTSATDALSPKESAARPNAIEPSRETSTASSATLSLDFAPPDVTEAPDTSKTGARSSKASLSSIEKKRRAWSRAGMGVFALSIAAGAVYMGREWEPVELAEMKMVWSMYLSTDVYV